MSRIRIEEYITFSQKYFSDAGKTIEEGVIAEIHEQFEGVTWYIQKILNRLYATTEENGTCTPANVEDAIENSVQAALNGLLEKEFLTRNGNVYTVYDQFFERWLRSKY